MKKIVALLEQKVQWMVLALGVAYVLYMAWTYIFSSPVLVDVAGEKLSPGQIDAKVLSTVGEQLDAKMRETPRAASDTEKPPQYVSDFKASMDYTGKRPEPDARALTFLTHGPIRLPDELTRLQQNQPVVDTGPIPGGNPAPAPAPEVPGAPPVVLTGPVDKLPEIPAPMMGAVVTGLTNVDATPPAQGQAAPTAGVQGVDKSWVTVRFEIDIDPLSKRWDETKFTPQAVKTAFLQVMLTRQELQNDGTWGNETVIAPLAIHGVPAYPTDSAQLAAKYEYNRWALGHTTEILQPAFYPRIKGDPWYVPGEQAPLVNALPDFKPENYLQATPEELMRLTSDQRLQVSKAKAKQQQEMNRGRGNAPPPPRGGGPRAPRGGQRGSGPPRGGATANANAPTDFDRPISYQPAGLEPAEVDPIDAPPAPQVGGVAAQGGTGKFLFPAGEFDPRTWVAQHAHHPIVGWAHDDTATPGGTYRYKVSYKMKNPVFGNKMAVKDAKLMDMLALQSADSEWSQPVDVASTVSFFVQGAPREGAGVVPIQIFRWKGGDPHTKTFQVALGDIIGETDGDVDYGTGWSVADFSRNPHSGDWVVTLMDPRGTIRRRSLQEDSKDQRYLRLKDQTAPSAPAAAATPH